ncbi:uncharacterized protein LOC106641676 [Copidosoma floridanum]|uniref:uncharacterized protein LOC106641676 n=1 Tax=Copidosoma floridanum TaxID=29053 RepID=UPI0006C97809|nr:uncharacterized protein LOC106641676 [Copidosoma floridanum]
MYDLDDNTMDQDSRSNSLKSSRHASPKTEMDKIKNGNYLDSIVGKDLMTENDRYKQSNGDGYRKEDTARQNGRMSNEKKEEAKNVAVHQSYHKKSKAERKQRLCVRSDDSMDLMFNDKEINYKDENDENDRMSDDGECDQDAGRSSANVSPTPSQTNAGSFRSARRKRARKVFDPSDNLIVKKKRGRYSNAVRAAMASAQQQELQEAAKVTIVKENTKGSHRQCNECSKETDEALMACRDCTVRVHPSCVYTPEEKALKARTSWQCDNCKSCATCYETKFNGPMVTCYNCNDSYHYGCHTPRVTSSKNKWFCCNCNPKREKPLKSSNSNLIKNKIEQQLNKNSNSVPVIVKTRESPVKSVPEIVDDDVQNVSINDHGPPVDLTIPDVTDWDEDQVYRYFVRLFPKDAEVFRSQQIDGIALKLLTKNEIYNRFTSIVFGTRVKIWMQIVYLQKRRMWTGDIWM